MIVAYVAMSWAIERYGYVTAEVTFWHDTNEQIQKRVLKLKAWASCGRGNGGVIE